MQSGVLINSNTGVGYIAINSIKTDIANIALGHSSMSANDGQNITAMGYAAFD